MSLTAPPRRSIVDGLVRSVGATPSRVPRLDADAPDAEIADFLAEAAHSDTGFVAVTDSGERALAIVAATTAALCGDDIHTALTSPDITFLTTLRPPAVEALRAVLVAVETGDPVAVDAALTVLAPG